MIFLAKDNKRRKIVRASVVLVSVVLLGVAGLLVYRLTTEYSGRAPITEEVASEYYHYYYTAVAGKKVALTFDDGPNEQNTLRIAEMLKAEGVPATFFFIGENVLKYPDVAKQVSDLGFPIGNHSFTHSYGVADSFDRLARELNSTAYAIKRTTGQDVKWFRPPFLIGIGIDPMFNPYIVNDPSIGWSLQQGYLPVGADIDSRDWELKKPEQVLASIDREMQDGRHIALLHDEAVTAKALSRIIEKFKNAGYEFVTLEELLIPPQTVLLANDLKPGDSDEKTNGAVSQLQWFLYRHGDLDAYAISGLYGDQTTQAVRRFQLESNLIDKTDADPRVYGIAEKNTRAAIAKIPIGLSDIEQAAPTPAHPFIAEAEAMIISFFSHAREILLILVVITFALVFIRLWAMLCLLAYRKIMSTRHLDYLEAVQVSSVPFISVVVPAWNEAENIEATICSLIVDRSTDKEIIVIDDGSTDHTAQIVEEIVAKYPEESIRFKRVQNGGKARALNIGIEEARSDVVMTMDADAIIRPGTLGALAKHFHDPSVGAVAGKVYTTSLDTLFDKMQALEYMIGQNIDKPALEVVNGIGVVPGPIGAWRKETVTKAGGFSTETLVEDQDMTLSVIAQGKRVIYEPEAVAYTETPKNMKSFLKQRFRWIYGTMQCFWKYKTYLLRTPGIGAGLMVTLPNIAIFNVYLPLMYPFLDLMMLWSFFSGELSLIILPTLVFTGIDLIYAMWGVRGEPGRWRLIPMVLYVRFVYRYLILHTVVRSLIRALEGRGLGWNKVVKIGEAQKFYFASIAAATSSQAAPIPSPITMAEIADAVSVATKGEKQPSRATASS